MLKNNGVPLYLQLKEKLLQDIRKNYKVNDIIPPEGQLEKLYKVSRITVRKAIDELQRENIVEKKQGKGTFVREQKVSYDANFVGSLTQRLAKQNQNLTTNSIDFEIISKEHFIKDLLKCERILCLKRSRYLHGKPFALMYNYFDINLVPNLEKNFHQGSLYAFLKERYNFEIFSAKETIEAIEASKKQALKLDAKKGFPLLSLQRLSFDSEKKPIEFSQLIIRSDMYQHKISLIKE
ncbi:MAG: GntR family transcriptional regulator [Proteobacteria bacterium]|nr:MAG: GntR family transcriptional regulator [Pseudomonadota bacterium]